jgi:hypothetical protein
MTDQYRTEPRRRSGWTANWPVTRTLAAALTDFAEYGLADEPGHVANLAAVTGQLIDGGRMSSSARQALAQVCYALRLHTR